MENIIKFKISKPLTHKTKLSKANIKVLYNIYNIFQTKIKSLPRIEVNVVSFICSQMVFFLLQIIFITEVSDVHLTLHNPNVTQFTALTYKLIRIEYVLDFFSPESVVIGTETIQYVNNIICKQYTTNT